VMYVVLADGVDVAEIKPELQRRIREVLNPLFKVSDVVQVAELPRTASAKVMRRSLRADYQRR